MMARDVDGALLHPGPPDVHYDRLSDPYLG